MHKNTKAQWILALTSKKHRTVTIFAQKLAEAQWNLILQSKKYRSVTFFAKKITTSRSVSHFCKNIELSQFWNKFLHWRLKNIELSTFLIRNVRKPNEICHCNLKNIETSHFLQWKLRLSYRIRLFFFWRMYRAVTIFALHDAMQFSYQKFHNACKKSDTRKPLLKSIDSN